MTLAALALAATTLTCVGNGVTDHAGPPKTESRSGDVWLDRYNNSHDGYTAEIKVIDGDEFRLTMPRELINFPAFVPMVKLTDDGRKLKAARSMGPRRYLVTLDRQTGGLFIEAPEGTFSGICRKG